MNRLSAHCHRKFSRISLTFNGISETDLSMAGNDLSRIKSFLYLVNGLPKTIRNKKISLVKFCCVISSVELVYCVNYLVISRKVILIFIFQQQKNWFKKKNAMFQQQSQLRRNKWNLKKLNVTHYINQTSKVLLRLLHFSFSNKICLLWLHFDLIYFLFFIKKLINLLLLLPFPSSFIDIMTYSTVYF